MVVAVVAVVAVVVVSRGGGEKRQNWWKDTTRQQAQSANPPARVLLPLVAQVRVVCAKVRDYLLELQVPPPLAVELRDERGVGGAERLALGTALLCREPRLHELAAQRLRPPRQHVGVLPRRLGGVERRASLELGGLGLGRRARDAPREVCGLPLVRAQVHPHLARLLCVGGERAPALPQLGARASFALGDLCVRARRLLRRRPQPVPLVAGRAVRRDQVSALGGGEPELLLGVCEARAVLPELSRDAVLVGPCCCPLSVELLIFLCVCFGGFGGFGGGGGGGGGGRKLRRRDRGWTRGRGVGHKDKRH